MNKENLSSICLVTGSIKTFGHIESKNFEVGFLEKDKCIEYLKKRYELYKHLNPILNLDALYMHCVNKEDSSTILFTCTEMKKIII